MKICWECAAQCLWPPTGRLSPPCVPNPSYVPRPHVVIHGKSVITLRNMKPGKLNNQCNSFNIRSVLPPAFPFSLHFITRLLTINTQCSHGAQTLFGSRQHCWIPEHQTGVHPRNRTAVSWFTKWNWTPVDIFCLRCEDREALRKRGHILYSLSTSRRFFASLL